MEATIVPAEAVLSEQRLWDSNGKDDIEAVSENNKINNNVGADLCVRPNKDDIETIGEYNKLNT